MTEDGFRIGDLELHYSTAYKRWEINQWMCVGSKLVIAYVKEGSRGEVADLHTVGLRPWEYPGPVDFWAFAKLAIEFLEKRQEWFCDPA